MGTRKALAQSSRCEAIEVYQMQRVEPKSDPEGIRRCFVKRRPGAGIDRLAQIREGAQELPKKWSVIMRKTIVILDALLKRPPRAHGKGGEYRHVLLNCIGQLVVHVRRIEVECLDVGKGMKSDKGGKAGGGAWSDGGRNAPPSGASIALIDVFVVDIDRFTCPVIRSAQDAVEMGAHHRELADAVRVGREA